MTPQEAIKILEVAKAECEWNAPLDYQEAFDMAISALQAQDVPDTNVGDMVSRRGAIEAVSNWLYDGDDRRSVDQLLSALPSVQPEIKPIDYQDCANAMLRMWMDEVITDGEYNRVMDKLNAFWRTRNERSD